MELDPQTAGALAIIAGTISTITIAVLRYLDRRDRRRAAEQQRKDREEHELVIWAAAERARRRDAKRRRVNPRASSPVPEFVAEEITDTVELVEEEREARARRESDRQDTLRPRGERPPRPGRHHDKG